MVERSPSLLVLALVLLAVAPACSSSDGGAARSSRDASWTAPASAADRGPTPLWGPGEDAPPDAGPPAKPKGPAIRVTWEALAYERQLFENPRHGFQPRAGVSHQMKIVLVSESHPEADLVRSGATDASGRGRSVGTAIVSDKDMVAFMKGLQKIGYFDLARDTLGQTTYFGHDQARGRVTVERGSKSVTLVSMRGQGTQEHTKRIPAIYSQVKQAVAALRNRTPTLSISTYGAQPVR